MSRAFIVVIQRVRRLGLVAAVTAFAFAAASAAAAAPTRAQFISKGDALCAQVARELVPLKRQAEAAQSLSEDQKWRAVARIWTTQIKIQARFNTRFHAIGVPAGDSTARSIVKGLDRGLVLARRVRDAFAARDVYRIPTALSSYVRFTVALNRRVAAYGFRVCGR